MNDGSDVIIVTTTCDQRDVLADIARRLIDRRLAACCQISGPVSSVYHWDGSVQETDEFECSIKTVTARLNEIKSLIQEVHSYDEPAITATKVCGGSGSFLEWVRNQSQPAD